MASMSSCCALSSTAASRSAGPAGWPARAASRCASCRRATGRSTAASRSMMVWRISARSSARKRTTITAKMATSRAPTASAGRARRESRGFMRWGQELVSRATHQATSRGGAESGALGEGFKITVVTVCHPERSEGSSEIPHRASTVSPWILRFAQNDKSDLTAHSIPKSAARRRRIPSGARSAICRPRHRCWRRPAWRVRPGSPPAPWSATRCARRSPG